jgi:accessory colonization factor AcfC
MKPFTTTATFGLLFLIAWAMPATSQVPVNPEKPTVVLRAYGPGGPAPAMREAAKVFGESQGVAVEINAGPTPNWKEQAMQDADVIFSGSEYMRTDFTQKDLPALVDVGTVRTLYLRPSAIRVRPAIPKNSRGSKTWPSPA